MKELLHTSHPAMMAWLFNERARLSTFTSWPLNAPPPSCMAQAGFYYFQQKDYAQCVYCGIIFGEWTPEADPFWIHAKASPKCPLMDKHHTAISYANSVHDECCDDENHSSSSCLPRRIGGKSQYKLMLLKYLFTILMLGSTLHTPVEALSIQELHPWKGIIATPMEEGLIFPLPSQLVQLEMPLQLCKEAETKLRQVMGMYKTIINGSTILNEAQRRMHNTGIEDNLVELDQSSINEFLQDIPDRPETSTTKSCININLEELPGPDACTEIIQMTGLLDGMAAAADRQELPLASLEITHAVTQYGELIRNLQEVKRQLDASQLPAIFMPLLNATCLNSCRPMTHAEYGILHEVRSTEKAPDSIIIRANIWCAQEKAIVTRYALHTVPYQEGSQVKKLQIPKEFQHVWLNGENQQYLQDQLQCEQHPSLEMSLCELQEQVDPNQQIQLEADAQIIADGETWLTTVPINSTAVVVNTPQPITGTYTCPSQALKSFTTQGTQLIQVPETCEIRIPHTSAPQGQFTFPTKDSKGNVLLELTHTFIKNPHMKIFVNGILMTNHLQITPELINTVLEHLKVAYTFYIIGFLIFIAGAVIIAYTKLYPQFNFLRRYAQVYVEN